MQCASEDILIEVGYSTEHVIEMGTETAESALETDACYSTLAQYGSRRDLDWSWHHISGETYALLQADIWLFSGVEYGSRKI